MGRIHLLVPIWTMGTIDREQVEAVSAAVAGGVGMAGCHGGMCDAFRNSTLWRFITGGTGSTTRGGDGVEYTVNVRASSSGITDGIADFAVCSEQYYLHVDPAVEVLNLTVPGAHAPVNLAAIEAGKHVYCEKPFAVDPSAGAEVLAAARERGLRVGSAPDTFLGAGHQTVRALVAAGRIGRVVAASAIWMRHGLHRHHRPELRRVAALPSAPGAVRHRGQHLRPGSQRLRRTGRGGRSRRRVDGGTAGRRTDRERAQHRLADMCIGLRSGTPHRCSGELAQHVLEVMAAFDRAAAERAQIPIDSRPGRPG